MLGVGAIAVCRNVGDLSVDSVSSSTCAFWDSPVLIASVKEFVSSGGGLQRRSIWFGRQRCCFLSGIRRPGKVIGGVK